MESPETALVYFPLSRISKRNAFVRLVQVALEPPLSPLSLLNHRFVLHRQIPDLLIRKPGNIQWREHQDGSPFTADKILNDMLCNVLNKIIPRNLIVRLQGIVNPVLQILE